MLSVAAVLSLSLFSERLQGALKSRSAEFIAADAQLRSDDPINEEWLARAQEGPCDGKAGSNTFNGI